MAMRVPDFEVAVEIQNTPQFAENGAFNPRLYTLPFNEFQMSPGDYEAWRVRLAGKFGQFLYTNVSHARRAQGLLPLQE